MKPVTESNSFDCLYLDQSRRTIIHTKCSVFSNSLTVGLGCIDRSGGMCQEFNVDEVIEVSHSHLKNTETIVAFLRFINLWLFLLLFVTNITIYMSLLTAHPPVSNWGIQASYLRGVTADVHGCSFVHWAQEEGAKWICM